MTDEHRAQKDLWKSISHQIL